MPESAPAPPEPFLAPPPAILEQPMETPPSPAPKIDIASESQIIEPQSPPALGELISFAKPAAAEVPIDPTPIAKKTSSAPRLIPPKKKPALEKEPKEAQPPKEKLVQAKQEILQFEPVTRGRFEKSEPTIVEGQDLDIPTFLRKNTRVK